MNDLQGALQHVLFLPHALHLLPHAAQLPRLQTNFQMLLHNETRCA